MKCLVTGGAGFIGSCLVRELLRQGADRVGVLDNCLTGNRANLTGLEGRIDYFDVDIRDFDGVRRALSGYTHVFHLAAIPSVPRSIHEPVPSHEVNIDGTFNVYRASKEAGVQRVVYAASSSAYGDTPTLPKVETMPPNPLSPYAVQKLMGEYYGSVFSSCFGMETVALRFFNVYGPRQDPSSPYSGVLSIFMKCLLEGTSPIIYGDGEQSRDFTYVEDVAGLLIKAAKASGVSGRVYNAGNGNRYTLNHVWDVLQEITGKTISPTYGPSRAGDVRDSQGDTTAAVRDLGHTPKFDLEEGLKRTFEWYAAQALGSVAVG